MISCSENVLICYLTNVSDGFMSCGHQSTPINNNVTIAMWLVRRYFLQIKEVFYWVHVEKIFKIIQPVYPALLFSSLFISSISHDYFMYLNGLFRGKSFFFTLWFDTSWELWTHQNSNHQSTRLAKTFKYQIIWTCFLGGTKTRGQRSNRVWYVNLPRLTIADSYNQTLTSGTGWD
jgi:hypothetical protein